MLEQSPSREVWFNKYGGSDCDSILFSKTLKRPGNGCKKDNLCSPYPLVLFLWTCFFLSMSIAPKQIPLFTFPKSKTAHGGSLGSGKRKNARPLCVKRSLHIVFRAEGARGGWSLLHPKHAKRLHLLLRKYSERFEVRIYEYANVSNHIHLLVRGRTKEGLRNLMRAFAGHSAQLVTGSGPKRPLKKRFWTLLVYTRIVAWGAFHAARKYLRKNIQQGASIRPFYVLRKSAPPSLNTG